MTKAEIRKKYLQKRSDLSRAEVLTLSHKIFRNFIEKFPLVEGQKLHCFLSIPEKGEVDTKLFLDEFIKRNIRVFVPKIVKDKLISVEIRSDTPLFKNSWGISEPEGNKDSGENSFDYVLVPLLYADSRGNRVGYGKGFYDALFPNINRDAVKVGLNFFPPSGKIDDVRDEDIPLDYLVTPTEVLSFGGTTSKSTK